MKSSRTLRVLAAVIMVAILILACGGTAAPTEVPTEAATAVPPTNTPKPTSTPRPTSTPNLAATQQVLDWEKELTQFTIKGMDMNSGGFETYEDFNEEWAQMGWYQWYPIEDINTDFMFGAHFDWSTASETPEISGCGIVFGLQEDGDHYSVFLDKARILFLMKRGSNNYLVGKTSGSGRANFGNPADTDFQVLVSGQMAYVSVGGEMTTYTLSQDQTTHGEIGLSVLSGTNKDYGTRCKMTGIHIWTPE